VRAEKSNQKEYSIPTQHNIFPVKSYGIRETQEVVGFCCA